jgi:Tol biopolymer transport system component
VAFVSFATNLAPGDTNSSQDVFVRDLQLGTTERISVDSGGIQGNAQSFYPSISGDGRFVSFQSDATNLVNADTNALRDVFVAITARPSWPSASATGSTSPIRRPVRAATSARRGTVARTASTRAERC